MTPKIPRQLFSPDSLDHHDHAKMVTRRSMRSFVEDELLADQRELQRPTDLISGMPLATATAPSIASSDDDGSQPCQAPDAQTNGGHHALSVRTNMEPNAGSSSGNCSSRASTSSTNSSVSSTPSSIVASGTVSDLDEDAYAGLEDDGISALPPGAPINFGSVLPGMFRSSYPRPENYDFLQQLGLKTIVTLVDKNFTDGYRDFMADNGIRHHIIAMKGTKKEDIPLATMESILNLVLDRRNFPLLIHCNQGRHRTGCVVAVVRKIAGWDSITMTDEYRAYAGRKVRDCDIDYITAFNLSSIEKLLASEDLDIDEIISISRSGGPMVGPPPTTTVGFRVPNFFRTTFFSMTVLLIWMISGSKMAPPTRR